MKTIEEQWIENQRIKYYKKKMDYLEADKNIQAQRAENIEWILNNIQTLIDDGYKYREIKENR